MMIGIVCKWDPLPLMAKIGKTRLNTLLRSIPFERSSIPDQRMRT